MFIWFWSNLIPFSPYLPGPPLAPDNTGVRRHVLVGGIVVSIVVLGLFLWYKDVSFRDVKVLVLRPSKR